MPQFDLNSCEHWTLTHTLRERAERLGEQRALEFSQGDSLGFAQWWEASGQVAALLAELGVRPSERVAVMLGNSSELCLAWAALSQLGAVHVALDPSLRGEFLRHALALSGARLLIVDAGSLIELEPALAELHGITDFLLTGTTAPAHELRRYTAFTRWRELNPLRTPHASRPGDIACVMFTSGTTGPAKAVLMPQSHCYLFGLGTVTHMDLAEQDHYYVCLPLFHANGLLMQVYGSLIGGARAFVRERFSASAWIDEIRSRRCTHTNLLGATGAFVLAQPARPDDREHALCCILSAPNVVELEQGFRQRFGIKRWIGAYGMTEVNIPLYTPDPPKPASCGRVWLDCFDVRIAHPETEAECAPDEIGELQVRPRAPHGFMAGYLDMPEATVEAWRGLWFHSGDAARMDADGDVLFIDRIKDCIRRRGENLSSLMIEQQVGACPGVIEVAAVAVPSNLPGGEDSLLLVVVSEPANPPAEEQLHAWCRERLPRAAQPDHLWYCEALSKTPTGKVQKRRLRELWLDQAS